MKTSRRHFLAGLPLGACAARAQQRIYPRRWVYLSRGLNADSHVEDVRRIVRTAAEHGLNGMVLAAGLDRLDLQNAAYFARLEEVKEICRNYAVEIVPSIFSVGYGGAVISHNRNLAAGIPVRDALFVARGAEARLEPDPPVEMVNPGLEEYDGDRVRGYRLQDQPGEVTFVDREVAHSGAASLRFENFTSNPNGHGRLMQEVAVKPWRSYRVTVWVRSEALEPRGAFRLQVLALDGRALAPFDPQLPPSTDWSRLTLGFNSWEHDRVRLYAGVWGGRGGRFWVDEWRIEEVGLVNVLRRWGTPLTVRGEESGTVYEEGFDYAPIADRTLTFRFDHDGPPIRLLPGGRVRDGERLRVSWSHGISINDGQVSVCMSEPELYDIWRTQARLIDEKLQPMTYLLSMDEIRAGGACEACRGRGQSMAEILGNCLEWQRNILREQNPDCEVGTWSDMLDPNHNAHGNYYLVDGDFTGSWEHTPRDLIIVCWYYAKRRESLQHFSGLGFRTLAGAYYDGDTLDNPKGWLDALAETPGAQGIMYTTWQNKYDLLPAFGDLVSGGV